MEDVELSYATFEEKVDAVVGCLRKFGALNLSELRRCVNAVYGIDISEQMASRILRFVGARYVWSLRKFVLPEWEPAGRHTPPPARRV